MTVGPAARKAALAAHVTSSVGWLGAVVTFLGLAVAGPAAGDDQVVRASYLIVRPLVWFVLVPFALASLLSGIVSSVGTAWGLVRHWWVLFKLVITVAATGVLLLYTRTVDRFAALAGDAGADLTLLRSPSFALHAGLALLALLAAVVLAVYKPRGTTGYGLRRRDVQVGRRGDPRPGGGRA